ncbi:MAG: Cysteine desulfurase [Myxococcaceae bacterium]|nr:Cysteine desulfurase [Myxococcaceae bacterium]
MPARVYLDHHATTPLGEAARTALRALLDEAEVGNASSAHHHGRRARSHIETARAAVARAVGAAPSQLTFTSGGTEATLLAVLGLGRARAPSTLWCDPGAHPCVVAAMQSLGDERGLDLRWIPTGAEGAVDVGAFAELLADDALVAASWVQHETGALLDVAALRALLAARGARWVLDGVQALGKTPVAVAETGADAVTFSAHKLGGPSGVGALWAREAGGLATVMPGGGQERGLRGGTENLLGIVGFGAAAGQVAARLDAMPRVAAQRDAIERALVAGGGSPAIVTRPRVATVAHVAWPRGVAGAELVAAFDLEGVSVSSGSACSSGLARPSASMARLYPGEPWRATAALRVSLSPSTTDAEVARFVEVARSVLPRFCR